MKCTVYFYGVNALYSQEYADMHHGGKETKDNFKFDWEEELSITADVQSYSEDKNENYTLQGYKNEEHFEESVLNMRLIQLFLEDGTTCQVGCSESILDKTEIVKGETTLVISVYIKDYEPYSNPVNGIYIASKEFPKNLL